MHSVDATTEQMIRSVLAYAENRLRLDPVPLDQGCQDPADLEAAMSGLIGEEGHNPDQVLGVYAATVAPAVISADSPRFLGFIPAAPTKASLLFDMLVSCASIQGISWLEAAGAIHAENQVLALIARRAGLPPQAGGCFVSGGSAANLSALAVAREMAKRAAGAGRAGRRWRVAVGSDAHSSIGNTLRLLEMDPLIVPSADHRLTGEAVQAALKADDDPASVAAVVATAGTTNAGMIDPLSECAEIARGHGLWYHIDAAWGGAMIASERLRGALRGLERADSATIDAHKWFATTMGCGMFLVRDGREPSHVFQVAASYMPSRELLIDPYMNTAQWSRRFLGLRLFLSLASAGWSGHAAHIERAVAQAARIRAGLEAQGWSIVNDSPLAVLSAVPPAALGDARAVVERVLKSGRAWVSLAHFEERDVVRICVTHGETSDEDLSILIHALTTR